MNDQSLIEKGARESLDTFNRGDWDGVRDLAGPGFVYEELATGRRFEGIEPTIDALKDWRVAFPDAAGELVGLVVDGDTTVLEIIWRGTHNGSLTTPAGAIPPTGRTIEVWAAMWQIWRENKMSLERHHFDLLTMLTQLGVATI
ncbi:MAG TPA: ester cyclase [Jatrophihabitans sp.]|jgi:predicted ester cyclase|uniref:ester cyclase n=1 Tax=Jatrophihabitans sp. TaxID=1932789 RepID=UPI002E031AB5|nr:ester cyclase [Jatrophihabitans sp.]